MRYGPIEATLDKVQGANVWLIDRPARGQEPRGAHHPGHPRASTVNRLIRVSFGPFQLLDLAARRAWSRCGGASSSTSSGPSRRRARPDRRRGRPGRAKGRSKAAAKPPAKATATPAAGRRRRQAEHEDRRRAVPRPAAGRARRRSARGPPRTACARPCSTSSRTASPTSSSRAPGCSTCSPAPARSGSRRCRAAPPSACSSRRTAEARALIRRNVEALGLTGVTKIFRRDATDLGPAGRNGGFTLAFLDPPYGQGLAERALASAAEGGWLAPGAVAVIEERKGAAVALPAGFAPLDERSWGDTQALFARFAGGRPERRRWLSGHRGSHALSRQRLGRGRPLHAGHRRAQRLLRRGPAGRRAPDRLHPLRHADLGGRAAGGDRLRRRRAAHHAGAAELARRLRHHRHRDVPTTSCSTTCRPRTAACSCGSRSRCRWRRAGCCSRAGRRALRRLARPWCSSASRRCSFAIEAEHRARRCRGGGSPPRRLLDLAQLRRGVPSLEPQRDARCMEKLRVTGLVVLVTSLASLALAGPLRALIAHRSRAADRDDADGGPDAARAHRPARPQWSAASC